MEKMIRKAWVQFFGLGMLLYFSQFFSILPFVFLLVSEIEILRKPSGGDAPMRSRAFTGESAMTYDEGATEVEDATGLLTGNGRRGKMIEGERKRKKMGTERCKRTTEQEPEVNLQCDF